MNGQNKILMMGMAVLVLAAVAFWLLRGDAPAPIEPSPMVPVPHPEPVAAAAAADPATEPERAEVTATAPSAAVPDLHLAHVRGRCVDEHGQPLADCTAKLGGWGANSTRVAMQGGVDWHDPEPIVTNTDGRFDLAFAPPSGLQFSFDASADGRVPRTGTIELQSAGGSPFEPIEFPAGRSEHAVTRTLPAERSK